MTYGQVRDRVLQLLNQYTVAGTHVAASYNNQQDYLNKIPGLVNDAMLEIATTMRKIPAFFILDANGDYEEFGNWAKFELPENFYQFLTGETFLTTQEGYTFHTNLYRYQGRNYLLVPKKELEHGGRYTITYYRYPTPLSDTPQATDELDNAPETHTAIPFYVAAFLVIHDDSFLYASFYNKYEDKLQKLLPDVRAEARPVDDVYNVWTGWVYDS